MATGEDKLTKIITCSVCLDPYKEPKTLKCDHSFCKQCVAKIVRAQLLVNRDDIFVAKELFIECPNCKTEHSGFRTVSEIRTSHVIRQILDFYEETCTVERPSKEATCIAKCGCCEKPSKCVCLRCLSTYCTPCGKTMVRKPCFKDAQVPGISGLKEIQSHFIVANNVATDADDYVCMEHSLSFDCFCTECEEIICIDCFLTNHADHVTKTIESVNKEATDLIAHLKSVRDGNLANRKDIESGAHRFLEKIDACESKVLADFEQQKFRMQNFISFIFDRAVQSYKKIFAERKEGFLKELTDSNTEENFCSFLPGGNVSKRGLSAVCDIGRMRTALAHCKEEEMNIESVMKFMREIEISGDEISLSINHPEIFKLCLKLFGNISLNPASVGKFCPLGITMKRYENVSCVAEGISSMAQANENAATHVHPTDIAEKQNSEIGDRFNLAEVLQKTKPKERIQYDRGFLLEKRFWNKRPDLCEMECTLHQAHFTFELNNPRDCQDGEQSIFGRNQTNQNMDVRLRPKRGQGAKTSRRKVERRNQNSEQYDNTTPNHMLGHVVPPAHQPPHRLQEDSSVNMPGHVVPPAHQPPHRLQEDSSVNMLGHVVPPAHQPPRRLQEDSSVNTLRHVVPQAHQPPHRLQEDSSVNMPGHVVPPAHQPPHRLQEDSSVNMLGHVVPPAHQPPRRLQEDSSVNTLRHVVPQAPEPTRYTHRSWFKYWIRSPAEDEEI